MRYGRVDVASPKDCSEEGYLPGRTAQRGMRGAGRDGLKFFSGTAINQG